MFSLCVHDDGMTTRCEEMVAVVCDDRPAFRHAVVRLLMGCGFDVAAVTEAFPSVADLALSHRACVVVVSLPLTGLAGLQAVRELRVKAPDCDVILMSPSPALQPAARDAGALALLPEDDLRALRTLLQEIARTPRRVRLPRARGHGDGSPAAASGNASTNPSE